MSNILVTGAKGQLALEIQALSAELNSNNFIFADRALLDISNFTLVDRFIQENQVSAIINCAAYTAVDQAEEDTETADLINHIAVKNLGNIALKHHLKLIHISTDYVFNGKAFLPYDTNSETEPQGAYGLSKLKGEQALRNLNPPNTIIIRTAWVYSSFGSNFVKTMLRLANDREELGVIYDQIGTPTYAHDLAQTILQLLPQINSTKVEVYHYTNEGVCSWYDFAKAIFEIKNISCKVTAIPSSAYLTKAVRPHYSVLNTEKIKKQFSLEIPYWRDSLKKCLEKI